MFALAQTATKFIAGVVMACRWRTVAERDRLKDHATALARESAHTGGDRRLQAKREGLLRRSRHVWQHTTRLWKKLRDEPISMIREYVEELIDGCKFGLVGEGRKIVDPNDKSWVN